MKKHLLKSLLAVALLLVCGNVWGESYTITFATGSGDGSEVSTSTACSTLVSAGADYLSGNVVTATKAYYNGGSGLKLGTASAAGTLKMNLSSIGQVTPTSIVVNAKLYSSSKAATLKVNGSATQDLAGDFADYTFNITSAITSLELVSSKYSWISSITVNYEGANVTTHEVKFYVNGEQYGNTLTVAEGGSITFPANPEAISGKTFVGWAAETMEGTLNDAPAMANTSTTKMGTADLVYYAVYAQKITTLAQTLEYDTWTYSGTTTDKSSYRLFHSGSYIESTDFDLSTLDKVIVYGGTFGGASYKSLTIGDGTNTWKSVTVSGSSQTGKNEYTEGTALSGTGKLRITSNSGSSSSNGVRISKVEIYTASFSDYCTTIAEKTLTGIAATGTPAAFWKGDTFNHDGMIVTATWSEGDPTDVTSLCEFSTPDMTTAGEKTVTVTYEEQTTTYTINVQTIANTLTTAYTVAQAKALIDAGKDLGSTVYVKGKVSKMEYESYKTSEDGNTLNYWISDDGTTEDQFEVYAGNVPSIEVMTLGMEVTVSGTIKKYSSTYEFAEGSLIEKYADPSTRYQIQCFTDTDDDLYGTVTTYPRDYALEGTVVTINAEAAEHYHLSYIEVRNMATAESVLVTNGTFIMPAAPDAFVAVIATFSEDKQHTVTYMADGEVIGEEMVYVDGYCVAQPSVTAPAGWEFVGWSENVFDGVVSEASVFFDPATSKITAAKTLYAVFAHSEVVETTEKTASVNIEAYAAKKGWANATKYETVELDANVSVNAVLDGNTGQYNAKSQEWRMYQSSESKWTVNAKNGASLNSVTFTYASENTGILSYDGSIYESGSLILLTGTTSKQFTVANTESNVANGQVRITDIFVDYTLVDAITTYATTVPPTEYPVQISSVGFATFYADEAVQVPEGVTAYYAYYEDCEIIIEPFEDNIIPAREGAILKGEAGDYTLTVTDDVEFDSSINSLYGTAVEADYATLIDEMEEIAYVYTLNKGSQGVSFYRMDESSTLAAHRAYLLIEKSDFAEGGAIGMRFGGTTMVEQMLQENNDATIYDLQGRKVENASKGLYIVGGKKVMVK